MPPWQFQNLHGSLFLFLRFLCIVCSCCLNVSSATDSIYSSRDTHAAFATLSNLPLDALLEIHSQLQHSAAAVLRLGKDGASHPSLRRGHEVEELEAAVENTAFPQSSHGGRSLLQFYITGQTGLWDVRKRTVGIPDDARVPRSFHSQLFGSFSRNLTRTLAVPSTKGTVDVAGNYSLPPAQELVRLRDVCVYVCMHVRNNNSKTGPAHTEQVCPSMLNGVVGGAEVFHAPICLFFLTFCHCPRSVSLFLVSCAAFDCRLPACGLTQAVHEGFAPKQGFGPMSPSCETMLDK